MDEIMATMIYQTLQPVLSYGAAAVFALAGMIYLYLKLRDMFN